MIYVEVALAIASWALVGVTIWMVRQQAQQQSQQLEALRADLRVRLQLTFGDRFDSERTLAARKHLAERFLAAAAPSEIKETVIDFFEDMGLFLRRGLLDEEIVWDTFGFYAVRWWLACKNYVLEERKRTDDPTVFSDFEGLVGTLRNRDAKAGLAEPTASEIRAFLRDESRLV